MMKYVSLLVFVAGLTVAAWYASYIPASEETLLGFDRVKVWAAQAGWHFGGGIALMIAGAIAARVANQPDSPEAKTGDAAPTDASDGSTEQLAQIVKDLDALDVESLPENAGPLADAIEKILEEQVPAFLDERQRLIDSLGLERFAEMIGHFATMERGTARAWSALTDDAYHEVEPSLARAQKAAKAALLALDSPS